MTMRWAASRSGSWFSQPRASARAPAQSPACSALCICCERSSRKRCRRRSRWCASQLSNPAPIGIGNAPNITSAPSRSWRKPSASARVLLPWIRSRPVCLRNLNRRWRSELRAASSSCSGHIRRARRRRAVGPSTASQASSAASRGARGNVWPCAFSNCRRVDTGTTARRLDKEARDFRCQYPDPVIAVQAPSSLRAHTRAAGPVRRRYRLNSPIRPRPSTVKAGVGSSGTTLT